MDVNNAEKAADTNSSQHNEDGVTQPKLDKTGLPLSPQPSSRQDDPLVSMAPSITCSEAISLTILELVASPEILHMSSDIDAGTSRPVR